MPIDALARARRVRLLSCDVDGVLTDGRIYVDDHGHEMKAFSALDGVGLNLLARAGIAVAWITGSAAPAVAHRARRLGIEHVCLDVADKLAAWEALRQRLGLARAGMRARRRRPAGRSGVPRLRIRGDGPARARDGARARAVRDDARRRRGRGARSRRIHPRRAGAHARRRAAARGLTRASAMTRELRARSLLDRITAWSPVFLLGGLAALTYWLDSQVQPPAPRRDGSERHDPDIFVEGFRAVTLDAKGRPTQLIAGKRALHFGDDQTTEFVEPVLAQTEAGKPEFRVTAAKGTLSGDRKEVFFTGNVRAVREAGPTVRAKAPRGPSP